MTITLWRLMRHRRRCAAPVYTADYLLTIKYTPM